MKLPFTEKFLWNVYELIEGISDVYTAFSLPSLKDTWYPDIARLRKFYKKQRQKQEFARFISYLKRRGYLKVKKLKTKKVVLLTPKGWQKVLKVNLKRIKNKKKRKDKKWIMVIFDIPEGKHKFRDLFREHLKYLGFQMLQKSIWVCPYDVLKEVETLTKCLGIKKYTRFLLLEEIEC